MFDDVTGVCFRDW